MKREYAEKKRVLREAWLRRKKALEALYEPTVDPIYTFEDEKKESFISPSELLTEVSDELRSIDDDAP